MIDVKNRKTTSQPHRMDTAYIRSFFPPPCTFSSSAPFSSISNELTRSNISEAKSASSSTFVTALVFNAIVFGAEIAAFTLLRPWFKAIYEPRTYVPSSS
jgi:hypothetical protein